MVAKSTKAVAPPPSPNAFPCAKFQKSNAIALSEMKPPHWISPVNFAVANGLDRRKE